MAAADLLAQRSPAGRPRPGYASLSQGPTTPGSPHTPLLSRSLSSQYGSPGSYRVEDETIIYDVGCRHLSIGFAGEPAPRATWTFGPKASRRAGDYSHYVVGAVGAIQSPQGSTADLELWHYDLINLDLGLVEDKLERALRTLHGRYLMLDLKHRSANVVLPPSLPNPLVEIVLKAIFTGVNSPKNAYLLSHPIMATVGGGLRSALVVDIGWHETTVTAVYEYREVLQKRSNRAGKRLAWEAGKILRKATPPQDHLPLTSVDEICRRFLWCATRDAAMTEIQSMNGELTLPLESGSPVTIPFSRLAEPVEQAFLNTGGDLKTADDHDLCLSFLIWKCLASLAPDVRTICVSRIVITGETSGTPGLRQRLLAEVDQLISDWGWDSIIAPSKDSSMKPSPTTTAADPELAQTCSPSPEEGRVANTAEDVLDEERDEITEKLDRQAARSRPQLITKTVRGVESLGAWAGASLMGHLKVEGRIEIKKDDFLKQGMDF
ncbi:Hypothetical protein D9617_38g090730 [Elsinoe fawcettii]|nr:Hypothetical protein D9617_38g090730 [Elsinoe fawcettii]